MRASLATAAAALLLVLGFAHPAHARVLTAAAVADIGTADVVILGAGMAGITAARNLTDAGFKVIVLEARNRTGGRLVSTPVKGGHVDLGAMWIHDGAPGNPLFDLVQQKLRLPLSPRMDYQAISNYQASGAPSNRLSFLRVMMLWSREVLGRITRLRATSPAPQDLPFSKIYSDFVSSARLTPAETRQANGLMHTTIQTLLNGNITQLSTMRYGDAKVLPAIDVMLRDGFDSAIAALSPGLDIRTNQVVTEVDYSGSDGVVFTTAEGQTFKGRLALVTPSLGVLKQGSLRFNPALPQPKTQAIAEMGMGVLDKTVLVFDRVFWNSSDFITREAVDWSGRWTVFLNYAKLFPGLNALVALNVADTARDLEGLSDDAVIGEAMQVLRSIYGKNGTVAVPDPVQTHVTRWAADPFSRGSYSYFAVGNPLNITKVLGEPVGSSLLFAGEATSEKPATVLGAYLSGLREAARAAKLLAPRS